jgi:hypothetical protein
MLKTTGLAITTPAIIPVPMFFTLAQENKREDRTTATVGVTVCEVSHCRGKIGIRCQVQGVGCYGRRGPSGCKPPRRTDVLAQPACGLAIVQGAGTSRMKLAGKKHESIGNNAPGRYSPKHAEN